MGIKKCDKLASVNSDDTKSLFLSALTVAEIYQAIKSQTHKGKLTGELNQYIQNWEYYPSCNAVNFLCKQVPDGNMEYFSNRIKSLVKKYHLSCCSCASDPIRNYFLLGRENNGIRFLLNENNIGSFIVYHWMEEPILNFK